MSNEVKIGILALATIAIGIWGFKFMKGQNLFASTTTLYAEYDQVDQLTSSAPIFLNGFPVGSVTDIRLNPENMRTIIVTMSIDEGIYLSKDAVATITQGTIMGGKDIKIMNNKYCEGSECAQDESFIKGNTLGLLGSMIPKDEVNSYMKAVRENFGGIVDTLNDRINDEDPDNKLGQSVRDLQASLANLRSTTDRLNSIMARNANNLTATMSNMATVTNTLANNNEKIAGILNNTQDFTNNLREVQLDQTLNRANTTLDSATYAFRQLRTTLETSDKMVSNINDMVKNVQDSDGTLGKLIYDKSLYENLNKTSTALDQFLTDFKEKPYRYVPLKSRRKVLKHDRRDAILEQESIAN